MSLLRNVTLAACVAFTPVAAFSAPLPADDYLALDLDGFRSIWTPNGPNGPGAQAFVEGNDASAYWSFDPNSKFSYDGSLASLTGTATNTGQSALSFDFNLQFSVKPAGNTPYCQQAGAGGGHNCGTTNAGIDPSDWVFFNVTSAMFTGAVGSDMEGLSYNLTSNPTHAPQAGEAANAIDESGLGLSMWFNWTKSGTATSANANKYSFNSAGKGDINIDLEVDPNGGSGVVPLPAAGWLLLAGIGGLGVAGRRKKA